MNTSAVGGGGNQQPLLLTEMGVSPTWNHCCLELRLHGDPEAPPNERNPWALCSQGLCIRFSDIFKL